MTEPALVPVDPNLSPDPDANADRTDLLSRMRALTATERAEAVTELVKRIDRTTGPRKRLLQEELRRVQEVRAA